MKTIFLDLIAVGLLITSTAFGLQPQTQLHKDNVNRQSALPGLPFPDNPDPNACGIPQRWGSDAPARLTGFYGGELVQPTVFLYDSHLRRAITGWVKSGTAVRVLLFQDNPALNFYLVKTIGENPQEGWVPAPFLKLEPSN